MRGELQDASAHWNRNASRATDRTVDREVDRTVDRAAAMPSEVNLRHLERVEWLASLMDEAVQIPGTSYRVGLDGLIGLVPVVGDVVSLGTNAYVIYVAEQLGVSRAMRARMLLNASVDFAIGSIPLVGDLFDVAFKSHLRNLTLLRSAIGRQTPITSRGGA